MAPVSRQRPYSAVVTQKSLKMNQAEKTRRNALERATPRGYSTVFRTAQYLVLELVTHTIGTMLYGGVRSTHAPPRGSKCGNILNRLAPMSATTARRRTPLRLLR
jgi:hypothetical protein